MRLLVCAAALSITTLQQVGPTLTFDEALRLATARAADAGSAQALRLTAADLRRARLPNVRAEVAGNSSRTLDLFSEGPLEVRYASSVLAFDYPLWDGGATSARISGIESKLRRLGAGSSMDDARFADLLNAFGDLYLAQRQSELLRPLSDQLSEQDAATKKLLDDGEISNLTAADRREVVLGFESRLLELEARRVDALTTIRLLTGVEGEPRLVIDFREQPPAAEPAVVADDAVKSSASAVEDSRTRLREVQAAAGFRATLSGFAGIGSAQSQFRHAGSEGSFGIYGLRVLFSYPIFRGASTLSVAEARADVEQSVIAQTAAVNAARLRADEYRYRQQTAAKRIELLQRSIDTAKQREASIERLASAGLRSEADVARAHADRVRREIDLLAAQIDSWKAARLLSRMSAAAGPERPRG